MSAVGDINQIASPSTPMTPVSMLEYPAMMAHRGGPNLHPEGTMQAFRNIARDYPDHVIEMDVRALKDGTLALCHDETITRLSADGRTDRVADLTLEQWRKVRIKDPLGGPPAPAAILQDVLDEFGGTGTVLSIEIKDPAIQQDYIAALWPYRRQVVACSFDVDVVSVLVRSGFYAQQISRDIPAAYVPGINCVSIGWDRITKAMVDEVHALDAVVWAWTINDPTIKADMLAMGVDGIVTNEPGL